MEKRIFPFVIFFCLFIGLITGLFIARPSFLNNSKKVASTPVPTETSCTLEAKICPDGSSVGRTGPRCEFAPCPTLSQTPTFAVSPSPVNPLLEIFRSETLGIEFSYLKKNGSETIQTKQIGSSVYVYPNTMSAINGQRVEIFKKPSSQTLFDAVKEQFLAGKSEDACFVSSYQISKQYPSSYIGAEITYPVSSDEGLDVREQKSQDCSPGYTASNGIRYFLMDSNHPSRFIFFDIGQYSIESDNNLTWQETLRVIN